MSINKLLSRSTYTRFGRRIGRRSAVGALIAFIFYVCTVVPFLPQDSALLYWTQMMFEVALCLLMAITLSGLALALIYGPRVAAKPQENG